MARFFVSPEDIHDNSVTISSNDAFHIARTLRMACGDEVTVCDGSGTEYVCSLSKIRDNECVCEILSQHQAKSEPPLEITLYMAYPKGDKLETVVQKAVELGVSKIIPFESSRCIKRPAEEKLDKITERLNKIAHEASKQCGRAILPSVLKMQRLKDLADNIQKYDLAIFCYEGEGTESLKTILENHASKSNSIAVIIGSEGGFSKDEAELIISKGAYAANLGPRILRCETAPDYCLSAISYFTEL